MAFKKFQINFFNNILMATSALCQQAGHFVCHLRFFCYWVDGRDQNKNDFLKSGTDLGVKSIYGLNQELAQNVGIKSAFSPFIYLLYFPFFNIFVWLCFICFLLYCDLNFNMLCVLFHLSAWCMFRLRIMILLIIYLLKSGIDLGVKSI